MLQETVLLQGTSSASDLLANRARNILSVISFSSHNNPAEGMLPSFGVSYLVLHTVKMKLHLADLSKANN